VKRYLAFCAPAALLSLTAFAQNAGSPSVSAVFDSLDSDHDGFVTAQDAQAAPVVAQSFASADKNGDGKLSKEEFTSAFTMRQPAQPPTSLPPETSPPPR
jgi:Ca2+-binding EF-hand superfamily protein